MHHTPSWSRVVSRRRFVLPATGAVALIAGSFLWSPALAGAAPPPDRDDYGNHDHGRGYGDVDDFGGKDVDGS